MTKEEKTIKLVKKIHELKACNKHLMTIADGNMCIHLAEQCALIAEEYSDQQNAELTEKLAKAEADKQELLEFINNSINDCEKISVQFYKDGFRFSEMSSEGMKIAYMNVRNIITKHGQV